MNAAGAVPAGSGHSVSIDASEVSFRQEPGDTLLRAALRAGIGFPYECNSGGCGSCRFQLLDGEVDDRWPDAPGRSDRDRRTGRLLACQCCVTSDARITVRTSPEYAPVVAPVRHSALLLHVADLTHDMRLFRFATAAPAAFLPGQYAVVDLLNGVSRCYSMSNVANEEGVWEFIIRRVPEGRATSALFDELAIGDEVEIDGPYGLAWLRTDNERDIVCVAGGSGLAPMLSIALGASEAGLLATRQLHFFYGARTPADVCGGELLAELVADGANVHFHPVVSMPEAGSTWAGATGFVHEVARERLGETVRDHEWYFAGPAPMTQALQELLVVELLVPVGQIHFDRFC